MNLKNSTVINTGLLTLQSLVIAAQVLIIVVLISLTCPIPIDPFVRTLYPFYIYSVHPERDILFFRLFVMISLGVQVFSLWFCRQWIDQEDFRIVLHRRLIVQGIALSIQLTVIAKAIMVGVQTWEWGLGCFGLVLFLGQWFWNPNHWPLRLIRWATESKSKSLYYRLALCVCGFLWWSTGKLGSIGEFIQLLNTGHFIKAFVLFVSILMIGLISARMLARQWGWTWCSVLFGIQGAIGISYLNHQFAIPFGAGILLISAVVLPRIFRQCSLDFLVVEGALTFMLISAWFKTIVYAHRPWLAQHALELVGILLVVHKIIFPILPSFIRILKTLPWSRPVSLALPLVWIFIIYVPDYEAAVARMFIAEQFHHTNAFIMAPGWSYLSGNILNVDTIARYGIGLTIIISEITERWAGGYSYVNVFLVILLMVIAYCLAWYVFFMQWFKNTAWTALVMLMALRWVFFQTEVYPFIFTYPNATAVRCLWDIAMIFIVWRHIITKQIRWLIVACMLAGWAIFYTLGDGIYLTTALFGYILMHVLIKELRPYVIKAGASSAILLLYPALTLGVLILCLWLSVGSNLWQAPFWQNMTEFMKYYSCGFCVNPMFKGFTQNKFMEAFIGFVLPVFYTATILWLFSLQLRNKGEAKDRLVIFMSLYALMAYHYYVMLSNNTSYYRSGFILAFLLVFWVQAWVLPMIHKVKWFLPAGIVVALYALLTNHNFISYPNIFNVSSNPMVDSRVVDNPPGRGSYFNHLFRDYDEAWKLPVNNELQKDEKLFTEKDFKTDDQLKDFFRREFDFATDARLIAQLTSAKEKVALISSFETEILIEAKRRPMFFYFELLNARPMHMRMFTSTSLYTKTNLRRTIHEIETNKPKYIFMERIFLSNDVPASYFGEFAELMDLLAYVRTHYQPGFQGRYLVAMQRKDPA